LLTLAYSWGVEPWRARLMDDFFVGIAAGGGQEAKSGVETKAGESLAGSVATPVLWSGDLLILDS